MYGEGHRKNMTKSVFLANRQQCLDKRLKQLYEAKQRQKMLKEEKK